MRCPDCRTELTQDAAGCPRCGWIAPERRGVIPCAFSGCDDRAMVRHNNANLCRSHYDQEILAEARKWCEENDLASRAQQHAFYKDKMRQFVRRDPPTREARVAMWERVLGTLGLPRISYEFATEALAKLQGRSRRQSEQREPGEEG